MIVSGKGMRIALPSGGARTVSADGMFGSCMVHIGTVVMGCVWQAG